MEAFTAGFMCSLALVIIVIGIVSRFAKDVPTKLYVVSVDSWNGTYSRSTVVSVHTQEERAKQLCRRMNVGNNSSYAPVYSYETCELDEVH